MEMADYDFDEVIKYCKKSEIRQYFRDMDNFECEFYDILPSDKE